MASHIPYVLGIDLGSNSLGWAALRLDGRDACGLLASGVRIFPAGMAQLESGRDESPAAERRQARLQRRQTDRRRRRIQKIYNLLASYGLLPPAAESSGRIRLLRQIDGELSVKFGDSGRLPYLLRAAGLDRKLEPVEFGRAMFHLAQRRGFLSNRKAANPKAAKKPEKDQGEVRESISRLESEISAAGCRTLGEFLSRLDPAQTRIRGRYTSRAMYLREFESLWEAQAAHHPLVLTEERKRALLSAMFYQRPLRDQSELVGDCELEPQEKRAPVWHPLVQRFRLLQEVNHLRLVDGSGTPRPLDPEQRAAVLRALEDGDMTIKRFKKLLGLRGDVEVNLERGGKEKLIGDRTGAELRRAFLHRWDEMTEADRLEAITDLASDLDESSLEAKARDKWSLDPLHAEQYSNLTLEFGKYAGFSLKAICKLLPYLESGSDITSARLAAYPETGRTQVLDFLPPVQDHLKQIRNPAVVRALTELRKVTNALLRKFGKPDEIHIELATELKAPQREREARWKRMRQREKERGQAFERLLKEVGITRPSRADIEKLLLYEECGQHCPYTGKGISFRQLFHSGEVQVEHIIPFSRSLDDSFANKTLAYVDVNARKGQRTPREAFGGSPEWPDMLERVRAFRGDFARHKLHRFQWTTEEVAGLLADFTTRQLNDTRYASRLAGRYLSCLYGGLTDEGGNQRVYVSPGQVTAFLRRLWSVEGLLSAGGRKTREDHRQHLIDAVVVALTGPRWVKALSDAAGRARDEGRPRFASLEAPWEGFVADVRQSVERAVPSHRVDRKATGRLHAETLYGRIQHPRTGECTVVRKLVHRLSKKELEAIVDTRIRERVELQWGLCEGKSERLEADPPTLPASGGRAIPIRKVRIRIAETPRRLADGLRARNVIGGDYHHFEIIRRTHPRTGKIAWDFVPVGTQEAMERVRDKKPLVARDHGPGAQFVCSIAKGDTLEVRMDGEPRLVIVRVLEGTTGKVALQGLNDARPFGTIDRKGLRPAVAVLMTKLAARKVTVSPLGEVRYAND
ncbi:MAG: type II CRISPR RNA-guided endonuclease Cas9 [Bryobacterales bacterium]|nr:type II CRISPR RNA-guided endonuclease Cas9 [Bryobacterales bacterium]